MPGPALPLQCPRTVRIRGPHSLTPSIRTRIPERPIVPATPISSLRPPTTQSHTQTGFTGPGQSGQDTQNRAWCRASPPWTPLASTQQLPQACRPQQRARPHSPRTLDATRPSPGPPQAHLSSVVLPHVEPAPNQPSHSGLPPTIVPFVGTPRCAFSPLSPDSAWALTPPGFHDNQWGKPGSGSQVRPLLYPLLLPPLRSALSHGPAAF